MKKLMMLLISLAMLAGVQAFEIASPVHADYNTTAIHLDITHNQTLDYIEYKIDGGSYLTACENCSSFSTDVSLSEGGHEIRARAALGNESFDDHVDFDIDVLEAFNLDIIAPVHKVYAPGIIPFDVRSNDTLDNISARVGSQAFSCVNCSQLTGNVNLTYGDYVLHATGSLDSRAIERSVSFVVWNSTTPVHENRTEGNHTGKRFDIGYEKLPQMLESGEISDADLAAILRSVQLNPGIINRLIKSGKLGNMSINAILDNQQFRPRGMWDKFLSFIGYHQPYGKLLYEHYNLTEEDDKKLVVRDDLPKDIADKVQKRLKDKVHGGDGLEDDQDGSDSEDEGSHGKIRPVDTAVASSGRDDENSSGEHGNGSDKKALKSLEIGRQLPPGQEKKGDQEQEGSGHGNPGRGNGRGRGQED